ncbi:MAG: aquaporin family protein [Verrucomicrobium sp.]|nr:aquaporin family protein [Verrucomicrobium sp.]
MKFTPGQEFLAELLGTLVLILFGVGSVAMVVLFGSNPPIPGEVVKGGYTNIVLGWGLAVTFGVYIAGTISGAHLNPAVTIAMAATKRFPWSKAFHYILGQFIGAFLAAGLVFAVYHAKWLQVDPSLDHTTGVFCTFPAVPGFWPGFFDQVVGTALLVGLILAVVDKWNALPGSNMAPLVIGLIVVAIGIAFGGMHGYAINPARDLGPRLFAVVAGFTNNGLTDGSGVWLVPVLGPIVGGLLGAFVYDLTIGCALAKANKISAAPGLRADGEDPSHRG